MLRRPSAWPATLPGERCSSPAVGKFFTSGDKVWNNLADRGSLSPEVKNFPAGP